MGDEKQDGEVRVRVDRLDEARALLDASEASDGDVGDTGSGAAAASPHRRLGSKGRAGQGDLDA